MSITPGSRNISSISLDNYGKLSWESIKYPGLDDPMANLSRKKVGAVVPCPYPCDLSLGEFHCLTSLWHPARIKLGRRRCLYSYGRTTNLPVFPLAVIWLSWWDTWCRHQHLGSIASARRPVGINLESMRNAQNKKLTREQWRRITY